MTTQKTTTNVSTLVRPAGHGSTDRLLGEIRSGAIDSAKEILIDALESRVRSGYRTGIVAGIAIGVVVALGLAFLWLR